MKVTQEKERKKKLFSKTKPCNLFHHFTILISSFCLSCTYFTTFSFLCNIFIFTIFNVIIFHSILLLSNARDITNFTTYVLQISISSIKKIIISNIYSLYCLSNITHIFTTSICKICCSYVYELVIFVYLF